MRVTNPRQVRVSDAYYSWLCDLVEVNKERASYWMLLNQLMTTPFFWRIPNDDNRSADGVELRERFLDEHNIFQDAHDLDGECSFLELIIGLSYRCEAIMADQDVSIPMKDWFWRLLRNARLDVFTDDNFHRAGGHVKIDQILTRIEERTFHRNGEGGLFPLKCHKKDQRKVELWYQMNFYLDENYYLDEAIV